MGGGYRGRRTTMSSTPRAGRTGPFALAHPLPLTDPGSDGSPRAGSALTRRAFGAAAATGMLALSGCGGGRTGAPGAIRLGHHNTAPAEAAAYDATSAQSPGHLG